MTRKKAGRKGITLDAAKKPKAALPMEEGRMGISFVRGDIETDPEIIAMLGRVNLNHGDIDHESIGVLSSMGDELQIWNAIVILAHTKVLAGEKSFGKELEHELVGAIKGLKAHNISRSMAGLLKQIVDESPNELARAAARKKLEARE
ncbi:MAG TPA: hypothetical protein VLD37_04000 [Candidatus Bilamarchaeum sp.]|nr:hypothetical protein [Candidatus Bilamarchaeum sp.]